MTSFKHSRMLLGGLRTSGCFSGVLSFSFASACWSSAWSPAPVQKKPRHYCATNCNHGHQTE